MTDTIMQQAGEDTCDAAVLREKAVAAKEAVAELAGEVRRYASDRIGRIKSRTGEKIQGANETVVDFVQEHPYKSLAVAAGLGLALGMLLRRH